MSDPIELLTRWTDSGAYWRVRQRTETDVVIDLVTCTGDEVVDQLISDDPALLVWLGDRTSSED